MAKFASIITLFFAALVLFASFEAPTMAEAQKLCEKPSGTCTYHSRLYATEAFTSGSD
ncbi:hypothetical protein AALP_AAs55472U000100 [Arabis alpina]|uniref:Uncharacterized protein n=1 Tax=Arabis alpina TaxID=50452 RepID=A0A087FXI4_ARAAL|nr:hypothetical protein AALP_AAs55472U000100 [Arabis alpina]